MLMMNRTGRSYRRPDLLRRLMPLLDEGGLLDLNGTGVLSIEEGEKVAPREYRLTANQARQLYNRLWRRK